MHHLGICCYATEYRNWVFTLHNIKLHVLHA